MANEWLLPTQTNKLHYSLTPVSITASQKPTGTYIWQGDMLGLIPEKGIGAKAAD